MAELPPGSASAAPGEAVGETPMEAADSPATADGAAEQFGAGPVGETVAQADPYGALRGLIVGPEQARLDALEGRLDIDDVRADEVARVLPEAVRRQGDDPRFAQSMQPLVARGFDAFIEAGQARVVEALTPVMGALIRQWVARELKARLAELSRVLDQSFSPRSLAWRVEALVTRRSFGEIVLLRTLRWRVVRALLIHAETGILLRHISAARGGGAGAVEQDPDVVSSMLTAVQSYLQDGFGAGEDEAVETISIGDKTVWIANTARAVLAVELAGAPDPMFRGVIDETMIAIDQRAHRRLADFDGDVDRFSDVEPLLLALVERSPDPPPPRLWPALTLLIAVMALVGYAFFTTWQAEARWQMVLDALEREPGIVVVEASRDGDAHRVSGLHDPLARAPTAVFADHGFSPEQWVGDFEHYHAHHPELVKRRLQTVLDPPDAVELVFDRGTLTVFGEAPVGWWRRHAAVLPVVPGVHRVETGDLRIADERLEQARLLLDPPPSARLSLRDDTLVISGEAPAGWLASAARRGPAIDGVSAVDVGQAVDVLDASTARIEAVEIEFAPDVAELTAAGEAMLTRTLGDMARLRQARPWLSFVVEGHADATGSPRRNAELRAARADVVADRLLGDVRLQGAVGRRPANGPSLGRIARIRVEVPGR